MLPSNDLEYLKERAPGHTLTNEAGMICVTIPALALPEGLDRSSADLLLRLSPGYPDVAPDMWWFHPALRRTDGAEIPCTQVRERHLGREWQRWSRHFSNGQWRSGIDSLESFLAIIRRELAAAAARK